MMSTDASVATSAKKVRKAIGTDASRGIKRSRQSNYQKNGYYTPPKKRTKVSHTEGTLSPKPTRYSLQTEEERIIGALKRELSKRHDDIKELKLKVNTNQMETTDTILDFIKEKDSTIYNILFQMKQIKSSHFQDRFIYDIGNQCYMSLKKEVTTSKIMLDLKNCMINLSQQLDSDMHNVENCLVHLQHDFNAFNFIHYMDFHRAIGLQVLDDISKFQKFGNNIKIMPSKYTVQKCQYDIEHCFFDEIGTSTYDAHGWNINTNKAVQTIIDGRLKHHERTLNISASCDGWSMGSGRDSAITWGIKLVNNNFILPETKKDQALICDNQSVNNVMLLGMHFMSDTTANAKDRFGSQMGDLLSLAEGYLHPVTNEIYEVNINICCDMKAFLQGSCFKGTAFHNNNSLFCCAAHGNQAFEVKEWCNNCFLTNNTTYGEGYCIHQPMDFQNDITPEGYDLKEINWRIIDFDVTNNVKTFCHTILGEIDLHTETDSKVHLNLWKATNSLNPNKFKEWTDAQLEENLRIRYNNEYEMNLNKNLDIISTQNNQILDKSEIKKILLKKMIILERYKIRKDIKENDKDAFFKNHLKSYIPCILHGEMRIGEFIIRQSVQAMYNDKKIKRNDANDRKERFVKRMKFLFCKVSNKESSSFKIEVIDNATVQKVSLPRSRLKKVFDSHNDWTSLMHILFLDDEVAKAQYIDIGHQWSDICALLRNDEDFTNEGIDILQRKIDIWGKNLIGIIGQNKLGYYTHLLLSGHIKEILYVHRNLHRYCNQNYEAAIGRVKDDNHFTNGGGNSGKNNTYPLCLSHLRKWSRRWMALRNNYKNCYEGYVGIKIKKNRAEGYSYRSSKSKLKMRLEKWPLYNVSETYNDSGYTELLTNTNSV
jgi:hypothetical protein